MSNILRIKRRSSGLAGAPASLENAELAYNEVDDTLYYGKGTGGAGGTATTVEVVGGKGAVVLQTGAQTIAGVKTFSSSPVVPTLTNGDNSTKAASTAYVDNAISAASIPDGDKGDITVSSSGSSWTIDADAVSNAKLANAAANTIKGNNTGVSANPIDMTVTQTKTLLALENVDNTADSAKPVSTAQSAAIAAVQSDADDAQTDATQALSDASDAQADINAHAQEANNPHSVTKTQVGLGFVDNTSDAGKPVSTAQQAALDLKTDQSDYEDGVGIDGVAWREELNISEVDNTADSAKPVSTAQSTAIGVVQTNLDDHEGTTSNPHSVTKSQVGLGNVDNTSDASKPVSTATQTALNLKTNQANYVVATGITASNWRTALSINNVTNTSDVNKPVSTAQQAALDLKINLTQKGAANGVATLDGNSKIPTAQLPALAVTDTFVVANQTAMLALTAEIGDVAVRTDQNKSYILQTTGASTLGNWQELLTPTDSVATVFGRSGTVSAQSGDYTVAQVTGAAPLASPSLTGSPTAPTAADNNNSTLIATTAYVIREANKKLTSSSNLSDLANAGTARGNLGLGTIATQAANNVEITGGDVDGVGIDSATITNSTIDGGTF